MSFEEFQQDLKQSRQNSETQRVRLKKDRQELGNVHLSQNGVTRNLAAGSSNNAELQALKNREASLKVSITENKLNYANSISDELTKLREHIRFTNPIENINKLKDDTPILLFPLRLETRFKKVAAVGATNNEQQDQLWVRVFPDDIAIDTFESDLSKTEIRNLRNYWVNRWKAGKKEEGNRAAWRNLVSSHGPGRAYWLIQQFTPDNLPQEPEKNDNDILLVIAVDEMPTDPILSAINEYWKNVWKADKNNAAIETAWDALVVSLGDETTAREAIEKYRPANINDAPPLGFTHDTAQVKVVFLDLPIAEDVDTKIHAWSQPPASTILPERFVLLCYRGDELVIEPQFSELVPPSLILGPDPASEEGEDFRLATEDDADANIEIDEGDLIFSEHMRWMFDFDDALKKGMGFKIDLTPAQARLGFDRVLVVGVKLAADKQETQEKLETLFEHHHSSRKGMGILKKGTPTNNTEEDNSGYSWTHNPDESFNQYFKEASAEAPALDWFNKSDGYWLADMLGLDPEKLKYIDNFNQFDISEAMAMQKALWPATIGHFMQSMMNPVFSDEAIENTRKFYTRYVNGRGSVPSIRVGKQPYGIFPVTHFSKMRWFLPREPDGSNSVDNNSVANVNHNFLNQSGSGFLTYLYGVIMDMDNVWQGLVEEQVSHVGKSGDAHQLLLDIIGLHPTSVDLYKRYANTTKQVWNMYAANGDQPNTIAAASPASRSDQVRLLARLGYSFSEKSPLPKIFDKLFFENAWILKGPRIDKVPNTETGAISSYTDDNRNYIQWLIDAAKQSHNTLRQQNNFIDDKPPTTLLYLLLYHALDLSYVDTSLKLKLQAGVLNRREYQQAFIEPDFIHIEEGRENESRWKHIYNAEPLITGDPSLLLERYIPLNITTLNEAAAFRDTLSAMEKLVNVPTASLERLLLEHIDTASYRYDAWLSGFTHLQLQNMRSTDTSEAAVATEKGIYIGAYGWLEDLRPENKNLQDAQLNDELASVFNANNDLQKDPTNAGYVVAPSQNHALTAAILRNGNLSSHDEDGREQLNIKLTSERVRLALQIIEGMQSGQSLSALLGYQFERGLHDRTDVEVDEFILDLRNAFPLIAKKIKETTPADSDPDYESITQIEANNVLDGVAFLEHITDTENTTYPFGLSLPTASSAQASAINEQVKQLININDAVADLAMAESVHQVVMGNYDRASAVLDTYSKGNFPPTPDVIKTPRSGIVLTHRFGLQFKTGIVHDINDVNVTPRMFAEPAMNDWLSTILPPMNKIICVVKYIQQATDSLMAIEVTMADLKLSPIDLLYMLDIDNEQAMSTFDDIIIQYVLVTPGLDLVFRENIEIEYTSKINADNFSAFEVNSLLRSLRATLLQSRHLQATDVQLPNEAGTQATKNLSLESDRIQLVVDKISTLKNTTVQNYIDKIDAIIASDDINNTVNELDDVISEIRSIFILAGRHGLSQTGIGFVYQWHQAMIKSLSAITVELHERLQTKHTKYETLRTEYFDLLGGGDNPALFSVLRKMELTISTKTTYPVPSDPADFYADHILPKFGNFENILNNEVTPLLSEFKVPEQFKKLLALSTSLADIDLIGVDISDQVQQLTIFIADLQLAVTNLSEEMVARTDKAQKLLDKISDDSDADKNIELITQSGKTIFGEHFVMIPEFSVSENHGLEWQNALTDSPMLTRYLENDLDIDFPVDDWFYGVSRVREKLYHIENSILHTEGFGGPGLTIVPTQFPYHEKDYWLGMQYPEKKDGEDVPFVINEDKLLYTAIYSEAYNAAKTQCGLLIDDWTEVIPSVDETAGLSFHYDQPNSEPPQALLLATPSEFTGSWQWDDLVNSLHSTLDLAKKRAVEPDNIDSTDYSLFLPSIVSLATPTPVTASLNLALNNDVFFAQVNIDE